MAEVIPSRRELLDRWRGIQEEEEEDDGNDPSKRHRINQHKEAWFVDASNFLISLPKQNHVWCGSWDIMEPQLEIFYNYFKDERNDSPLKLLWKRISKEMQSCVQCISQHHQAQEMYGLEYDLGTVGHLLNVLQSLDEERVTQHLRQINARLARQEYNPQSDYNEVVAVMYEVLMFPILLDDQSLFTEFEIFIEAVDNMHELALAGHQQFPGVYSLFFFNRRVRSIGRRLATTVGKLRRATDLEPLQPLLKKFVGFLETEVLPSTVKTSRPRAQLERLPIWLGITSLLEFLEPPALEEGILERYPIFFDIVLNYVGGDSPEFSHAVICLRELFKMLGCKLWLRSTLSPSVMHNTLLGQCFHTRNEKIHKDIFDLFQPFLQSLEALQDGEHEKQRRNFLYFLIHQVPVSNNFSVLTTKLACKIALLIVHRGYRMNPPCPPFECAHMWGPSLVSCLKDSSLHSSLRQPAFDLFQTIIVSDAGALITSILNSPRHFSADSIISINDDEDDQKIPFSSDIEEKDNSSWSEFSAQSKIASQEYRGWMCIPLLWIDVLVDIDPSVLPVSLSKAVFWARSQFSFLEPEITAELALHIKTWLSSSATEISSTFGWKVPSGCDDGGGGKVSKNSMEVSTMCLPLIRTFKRLTAHFIVQIGQGELRKQWTFEPRMSESLILLLVDPNDDVRQFGKSILEQVSNTRGLASGLKFLCSYSSSLSATFLGLRHALKLVQLDSVLSKFQALHHFFFILRKLFEEGHLPNSDLPENSSDHLKITKFSSQGGFLRQPVFDLSDESVGHSSNVDLKLWEKFHYFLSEITWPSVKRCLLEGKMFLDYSLCQVERRERDNKRRSSILLIRFYLQNGSSRLNQARRNLLERSKWHASRIMSITPQLREFQALSSLKGIPLIPVILKPVSVSPGYNESRELDLGKLSQPLQRVLKSSFNESQLQAIGAAIGSPRIKKEFELSLIQGPPGTGKTRTIVAIVSALLATKKSLSGHMRQSYSSCTNSRPKISQTAAIARAWQDAAFARQLNEDVEKDKKTLESSVRGRVLICAQSNAAVDELVSRISSEGLYGSDGKMYKPYLVRVGNIKTVHPNSLPFFIDTLVDHRLAEENLNNVKNDECANSSVTLRSDLEMLVDRIRFYEAKRANLKDGNSELRKVLEDETQKGDDVKEMSDVELEAKLRKLYEQKKQIYKDLSATQLQEKKSYEETKALKHKLRKTILREAEIVVTTLSGCGGDLYRVCSESISSFKFGSPSESTLFDAVLIDEAAQALEPATLIPLQLLKSDGTKCIMVGDPKQLPATVLSNVASKFLYECSMFERLQRAGYAVVMLTKQYRMHPDICRFPSLHFYESKLLNGEQMSAKSAAFHVTDGLGPYVFFDIIDGQELHSKNSGAFSLYNEHEADAAVELLRFFKKRYPSEFVGGRIGIITPYKCQLQLLRSRFSSAFGPSVISDMEFNTVDGFQGREVDILILSTVRAADSSSGSPGISSNSIGFVADVRRMNVALTRARLSLWILGNARTLQKNSNWAALVKDAKERNLVISVKRPYDSMFKSAHRKNPAPENPDNHSSRLKNKERGGDTIQSTKRSKRKLKEGLETKIKDSHVAQSDRTVAGDVDNGSAKRRDLESSRRRARDRPNFSMKSDHPSDVSNRENRLSKNVKSANQGEHVSDCKTAKDSGHDKMISVITPMGKRQDKCVDSKSRLDHSGEEAGDSLKCSKLNLSEGSKRSFEHDRSQRKLKGSTPSTGGSVKEQKADERRRDPNTAGGSADLIAKRKQQREAVDAILYSSLIPSKKSLPSVKSAPAKRSLSPTSNVSRAIKPSKKKKEASSTSTLQDQTHHQCRKRDKIVST
ncbi:uncharacterized protein LOC116114119 isoform X4 [Pistacia vera]|uniref:uncharacterized protein LOC116114119 isoform X4 n=1 Tax=Pistacia vera TaxID=55513 RepID=UPI00126383AC|nr:uncharacterized protein LOC116114119 isoform X4 [Pistacia vera]